jgi:hypothetical protein
MLARGESRSEASVLIAQNRDVVYDMVSDMQGIGRGALFARCRWESAGRPVAGALFTGLMTGNGERRNVWCRVVAAERGTCFAFVVPSEGVEWVVKLSTVAGYTHLVASLTLGTEGVAGGRGSSDNEADGRAELSHEVAQAIVTHTVKALKLHAEALAISRLSSAS